MSSNVREMRTEIQDLRRELKDLQRETLVYASLLNDTLSLMSRGGITSAADIRRMITLLYSLKAAILAVQAARMAAGDPLAWLGAGVAVVGTVVTVADTIGSYS